MSAWFESALFRTLFDTYTRSKNTIKKLCYFPYSFRRVEEYIKAGKDQNIVEPDENKVYTKRKQRQEKLNAIQTQPQNNPQSVKFPADGLSFSLQRMPPFNRTELDAHIKKSGKIIDPQSEGHSVPTGL